MIPNLHYTRTRLIRTLRQDIPIFVGESGPSEGPAYVLLDGLACAGFAWSYIQPALAKRLRTVHVHYRGHGRSGSPPESADNTIEDLALDVVDALDELQIECYVPLGHSIGVQVALELYRRDCQRIAALCLLCGSAGNVTYTFRGSDWLERALPLIRAITSLYPGASRGIWQRFPLEWAYQTAKLTRDIDATRISKEDFFRYIEHARSLEPTLFVELLAAAGSHSAEDLLHSIRVPTLVIAAEKDTFTPPMYAQRLADSIAYSEFHTLAEASHAAPVEQYAEFIDWITDFEKRWKSGASKIAALQHDSRNRSRTKSSQGSPPHGP